MAINESVQLVLGQSDWHQRTLVEVANAGQLFSISEAQFDRIMANSQIDESVQDWIRKARQFAAKLPADLAAAKDFVVKQTGKALDGANAAYVKAHGIIDKIPMIGRIPVATRNRLILGLALSFAAGMGNDAYAGDDTGASQTPTADPPAHETPAPDPNGEPETHVFSDPDPEARKLGRTEGGRVFMDLAKRGNSLSNLNFMRSKFFMITDRMAMGDVQGSKQAATGFLEQIHLGNDAEAKKAMLDLLMKVGQTAKANGVKMR